MFAFSSAGSWLAWTLRRTNFKQIHGLGSGLSGDYDVLELEQVAVRL